MKTRFCITCDSHEQENKMTLICNSCIDLSFKSQKAYNKGAECGLASAIDHIKNAREFLRGSTYSVDRLVGMMINSIEEQIKDLTDSKRILCDKGNIEDLEFRK